MYKNILLKISGETLAGEGKFGFDFEVLNKLCKNIKKLHLKKLPRGVSWFDTGTHDDLVDASYFIKTIEKKTNLKIACLEEIAVNFKWISKEDVLNNIQFKKGVYYDYVSKKLKL